MYHSLHAHDRFDVRRVSAGDPESEYKVTDQCGDYIVYTGDENTATAIVALLNTGSTRSEQRTFAALLQGMSAEIQQAVNAHMIKLFFNAKSTSESDARMAVIVSESERTSTTAQV